MHNLIWAIVSKLRCKCIYEIELMGDCVKTELFGCIAVLCKVMLMITKFMNVQYTCFKPDATNLVKKKKRYIGTRTFESNIYSVKGKELK